ncbi:MFS transporter [Sinosporangium siamense]|uniref:Uncharacterized protein n=1 Tax=Sinosporangium siamense TaxID=1367973 RepID=A0A919V4M8_9ACTN|nr:MFS transporter [Sinosporangium siamense]GII89896.1 hypothetical protein Ssi02_01270 [Sinosporangium siamense]
MPSTVSFRLVRTAAFAVVCAGLSVVAHIFGGGQVSGTVVVGALSLAFVAALPFSGRERTLRVILPLLAALQVVLHVLFAMSHAVPQGTMPVGHVEVPHTGLMPDIGMLVMHGWAVGLTALWLARGEALLWALLRRIGARLRIPVVELIQPITLWPAVPWAPEPQILQSALLRHAVGRRGPPTGLTAAL